MSVALQSSTTSDIFEQNFNQHAHVSKNSTRVKMTRLCVDAQRSEHTFEYDLNKQMCNLCIQSVISIRRV
jgi:hypothetical protein